MSTDFSAGPEAPAALVGALFTAHGLNAVYLGQPSHLRLRLAEAEAGASPALVTLTLDVAAAGAALPEGPAPAVPGGAMPVASPAGLAWQWWPTGEALEVALPELTFAGEPGLRTVPLLLETGGPAPIRLMLPLVCLRPAAGGTTPPEAGRVLTTVQRMALAGPGEGEAGKGEVGLHISYPVADGAAATPTFYLLLSEGERPGQDSLTTPAAAEAIELHIEQAGWQATRVEGFAYPAWHLAPRAGHEPGPGPLAVQLRRLRLRHPARGRAHFMVYNVAVPGAADGGQVVSLRWPAQPGLLRAGASGEDVSIVRFENVTTSLDAPGTVRLSWEVRNADYVTISGLGKVPAEGSRRAVSVQETTTFVLLAYGAGLSQLESRTLKVEVAASRQLARGTILLWGGQLTDIPGGWALCDGLAGRPDLRDRFVLGAGLRPPHTKGEADTHAHELNANQLTGRTSEAGRHAHKMPSNWYDRKFAEGAYTAIDIDSHKVKDDYSQEAGEHSHEIAVRIPSFTSGRSDSANRPPWYALCYIIKL